MAVRTQEEVQTAIAKLMADADALQKKSQEQDLSPEEVDKLNQIVSELEKLQTELGQVQASERIARIKAKQEEPVRPAPTIATTNVVRQRSVTGGEVLNYWLQSLCAKSDIGPDEVYRCRSAGIDCGKKTVWVPVNYRGLNRKQRTVLSKGGTGTGAELVWQSYSDKVVEYLTYFSPLVGMVSSETTGDGNARTYFKIDDSALESTYTSSGGGTEVAPTIPETNLATSKVVIGCFDITSGVQKVTFNELRDAYSAVNLEEKVAKANSNSHARKIEREILTATGNGSTGVMGVAAAATELDAVAAWDQDNVLAALMTIPPQYRANAIFVSTDATRNAINVALRDDIGRSLFERTIEDDTEFDTLFGKKYVVSQYCADDTLLVFVPEFYQLRLCEGQIFKQFEEAYFPNIGWAGILTFGGAWIGPDEAAVSIALEA